MKTALILFAHGARDPRWAEPFEDLRRRIEAMRPDLPARLAFLDLMPPDLETAARALVAEGAAALLVCPVFMAMGGHVRQDLPRRLAALRAVLPDIPIEVMAPIGEAAPVQAAMAAWIAGAADEFRPSITEFHL